MKMKTTILTMGVAASLLLAACSGTDAESNAAGKDGDVSGTLDFYTSQPDTDATELVNAFKEQHPDVEVNVFRSGTEEVIGKVLAEDQAGDVQADVLLVADSVTFEGLKEQDLLEPYESGELEAIPEEFIDPDHTYTGTKVMATVLAVNTDKAEQLPESWAVLTDTASKDEAIMPSPLYSGAAAYNAGVFTRQDSFGWDFYQSLKDNGMSVVQGNGAALKAVQSGEKTYGMVVDYIVANAKAEGSPVDLVYPEEGVPVITEPIGMIKDTDNEEAAKAFIDFVLSEEGQKLASELGYTPIRTGVDAPEGLKSIDEMNVLSAPLDELSSGREDDKREFKELFGE
jgi:iron(III) transport system substrate-binding protein